MAQGTNYIVFQCYGIESIFHECAFALLSLSRLYEPAELKDTEIWIYTDNPGWFAAFQDCPLPLHYRTIDQATIKQWRGGIDFVHRVKIELLLDFTSSHTGNVLYCDTDVVFTHRLDSVFSGIASGKLYMHMMEGRVSDRANPLLAKLCNFLQKANLPAINGKPLHEMDMWNAGVLGFNTGNVKLLREALEFTDAVHPRFPKHVVEQFAFSIKFQGYQQVKTMLPYIVHYWNFKDMRGVLAPFFSRFKDAPWAELVRYSSMIPLYSMALEKTRFLYNRTVKDKILNKPWQPSERDWDDIARSAQQ